MAKDKRTEIELTAYDDIFETDESRAEAALSKIRDIPLAEIDEFPDHPFKVLMDEDMEQLVDSINRSGVMTPATVRMKEDGRYELISGHRRKKACELACLTYPLRRPRYDNQLRIIERVKKCVQLSYAVQMMAEGPPEPPCRWRFQTTLRCCSQKLWY